MIIQKGKESFKRVGVKGSLTSSDANIGDFMYSVLTVGLSQNMRTNLVLNIQGILLVNSITFMLMKILLKP